MQDTDLFYTPVWQLRELLDTRRVSSTELTETFLRRIERLNPKLNAYLTVTGEEALAAAKAADEKIGQGRENGPLLGIPISLKDLEATKGIRSTMGSLAYQDAIPEMDSVVAERVKASGAVLLGKTNTPEFGLQGTTENRLGDPCRNPWNTERTAGGSSGGAGAAVAAGMCPFATGTDGGGSIRNPSSFNGIFGIKPTLGRVPRAGGLGRPAPNLTSQSGPMARNVRDAAILLKVLAGHDSRDPGSMRDSVPDFLAGLDNSVRGLRLAWSTGMGYAAIDPEVASITSTAARVFEELGCTVDDPAFALDNPIPAFLTIFYTGNYTVYGHLMEECPEKLSDNARFCFEHGSQATAADYARAIRAVDEMKAKIDDLMDTYDLLLTPTMAVPPFPIGQPPDRIDGKDVPPRSSYSPMTRPFNLSGQPAASVPCGFSSEGLPIGLHIIGKRGDEATVLRASAAFEQARPWEHLRPDIE
ncbi:MAG: glutamyl-tRNA amidotransferase [Chloroflexi bacterium]|nr:glutamyl-tRNA amidotransferase [Chloroflexota bacterium]MEE2927379.1 amidase [Chloroflexota bacterium]